MPLTTLPKGANAPVADRGAVRLTLRWNPARGAPDLVCFAVRADGRVPDEAWFLFYNQPGSPGDAIRLAESGPGRAGFVVQLERLPPDIVRCVLAATLDRGTFGALNGASLQAVAESSPDRTLSYTLDDAGDEQALILAELYRHGPGWKLRAVGQGFRGGLQPLAEQHGVRIAEPPPAPSPPSPPPVPEPRPRPVPPGRRTGRRVRVLAVLAVLILAGGAALWYAVPSLPREAAALFTRAGESARTLATPPPDDGPPSCAWSDAEAFEHYHALGKTYVQTLEQVEEANLRLGVLRQTLSELEADCPAALVDDSRRAIDTLGRLQLAALAREANGLNVCAGGMIKRIDGELARESRPVIMQRLVREADRARNLESDLTNMARDLAYLRNKTARLLQGYRDNLDACAR